MITIVHPYKHAQTGPASTIEVEWVPGKPLKAYLQDAKLSGMRTHCRVDKKNAAGYFEPVKTSHVPKDGDCIRLRRIRGAS